MHYLTKEILLHFRNKYLKSLKTKEDVEYAYMYLFSLSLADNPSDVYALHREETVKIVVDELYDFLEIWRKLEKKDE